MAQEIDYSGVDMQGVIDRATRQYDLPIFTGGVSKDFTAAVRATRAEAGVTVGDMQKAKADYAAGAEKRIAAEKLKGAGEVETARADAERSATIAGINAATQAAFRVNFNSDASNGKEASKIAGYVAEADMLKAKIREKDSVGFLDNPIEWFMNTLETPRLIEQHNDIVNRANSAQDDLNSRIATAKEMQTLNVTAVPTITAAQGAAKAKVVQAVADKEVALSEQDLALHNSAFAQSIFGVQLQKAHLEAGLSAQQNEMALKRYASEVAKIQFAASETTRVAAAMQLAEAANSNNALKVIIDQFSLRTGRNPGSLTPAMFNRLDEKTRADITMIGTTQVAGREPLEALTAITKVGLGPKTPMPTQQFAAQLAQWKTQIELAPENKVAITSLRDKGDVKAISDFVNMKMKEKIAAAQAGADSDPNSVFRLVSPRFLAEADPTFAESYLGKMLVSHIASPVAPSTEAVVNTIENAVRAQGGNAQDVAHVVVKYAGIAKRATDLSFDSKFFGATPQRGYQMQVQQTGWRAIPPVDITDVNVMARYFIGKDLGLVVQQKDANSVGLGFEGYMAPMDMVERPTLPQAKSEKK